MGSRQKAGGEGVRLPELSRRAVIGGTSVVAFGVATPVAAALAPPDEGARRCARWLRLDAKIDRLQDRWGKLESWLVREKSWSKLTPAERQASPWAKELRDIDGCLEVLFEQRDALLETLPNFGSASLESVISRLAVAADVQSRRCKLRPRARGRARWSTGPPASQDAWHEPEPAGPS